MSANLPYRCPACGNQLNAGQTICSCGADLTLLQRLDMIADAWFNRGLRAQADGEPGQALEWFSACCAARPGDAEARLAQAKTWGQLGRRKEALRTLQLARDINPDLPGIADTEQALNEEA